MFDKTIPLNTGQKKCEIRIGSWKPLIDKYDKDDLSIYLTDQNVYDLYRDFLSAKKTIILTPGESSKSFSIVEGVYKELVDMNADRSSRLIGFGGGVVTDIAGFIASTYMRGIDFGFVLDRSAQQFFLNNGAQHPRCDRRGRVGRQGDRSVGLGDCSGAAGDEPVDHGHEVPVPARDDAVGGGWCSWDRGHPREPGIEPEVEVAPDLFSSRGHFGYGEALAG